MIKKFIITTTIAFLVSGCTSQKIYIDNVNITTKPLKSHTFASTKLTATPKVSKLIYKIDNMQKSNSINLNLNATQNIRIGSLLDITAKPTTSGYLKILVVEPNGKLALVVPNFTHNGYIKAYQSFYVNKNKRFKLRTTNPKGLHYIVAIFTQDLIPKQVYKKMDSTHYNLINILQDINSQRYGKSHISSFPIRIY